MERVSRTLAGDVPLATLLLVDRELTVRFAAGARFEEKGYDLEAMIGRSVREVVPPELHEEVLGHYEAAMCGETRRFNVRYGHEYRSVLVPIHADGGVVAGALSLAWDEGEELRAERAAGAELTRRLEQQSAVARLGELALQRPPLDMLMGAACRAVAEGFDVDCV